MIAKRITRSSNDSSFGKLARYIVAARGGQDPRTWERTADYILDSAAHGEKVGHIRITNCHSIDPAEATQEIIAVQALNTRSRGDKTYHLVVSFPPGEVPSDQALHDIEKTLCEAIGLGTHQRISATHTDTAHLHIHIAINKVNPVTYNNVEPYYDKDRLMKACERLEVKHGLQRTHHGDRVHDYDRDIQETQAHGEQRTDSLGPTSVELDPRCAWHLLESYASAIGSEPEAITLHDMRTLPGLSLDDPTRRPEVLLPDRQNNDLDQGRTRTDPGVRRPGNGRAGQAGKDGRLNLSPKAAEMLAHSGEMPLVGWLQTNMLASLRKAESWTQLHRHLAEHGLQIVPAGAGLAIRSADGRVAVRASSVHRDLSKMRLEQRMGAYVAPKGRPNGTYATQPAAPTPVRKSLYTEYQAQREQALVRRREQLSNLRKAWDQYTEELAAYHQRKRAGVARAAGNRRPAYMALASERREDWSKRREIHRSQVEAIIAATAMPTWNHWLAQRAVTGDHAALRALRQAANKRRQRPGVGGLWSGVERQAPTSQTPTSIDKAGTAHYTCGGTAVTDGPNGVRVEAVDRAAIDLALELAQSRFGQEPLQVSGSDAFCAAVLAAAAHKGILVELANPAGAARPLVAASDMPQQRSAGAAPATPTDPLQAFIAQRNVTAKRVQDLPTHRLWLPADAGVGAYQGQRKLPGGAVVALVRTDAEMLVLPITPAQAAKLRGIKIGEPIRLDPRGRIMDSNARRR